MLTDQEVRTLHTQLGGGGLAAAAASAVVGLSGSWPLFDSLAGVGGAAGSMAVAGAVAHHAWYFSPARSFRRELGGPVGWLDGRDLREYAGPDAVRASAGALFGHPHPAMEQPINFCGWEAGRLVSGPRHLRRRPAYAQWARPVGILGPPGSGKSQYLIRMILDVPGAAVVSSTKPELAAATRDLREQMGPVWVFNPLSLGDLVSSLRWDPVAGCDNDDTATRRAQALVRGAGNARGTKDADFWTLKAVEIIRCYLMAAALSGRGMEDVLSWANNPSNDAPIRILEQHANLGQPVPRAWVETLRTHLAATPNTRTGYFATVVSAVGFVDNPVIAEACRPGGGQGLDVAEFLAERGTLYLIGSVEDVRLAPLFTALVEHLFDQAKRSAAEWGGTLPVPCAFLLDEVAQMTPVPLDRWAADSRGWGITVCAVFQSLAQLSTTWGRDAADVIWQSLPVKVILPGVSDTDDLNALAYLGGKRRVARESENNSSGLDGRRGRSVTTSRTRELVIEGDLISRMPRWHAYVLGLAPAPAVVRYTPGYQIVAHRRAALGLPGPAGSSG